MRSGRISHPDGRDATSLSRGKYLSDGQQRLRKQQKVGLLCMVGSCQSSWVEKREYRYKPWVRKLTWNLPLRLPHFTPYRYLIRILPLFTGLLPGKSRRKSRLEQARDLLLECGGSITARWQITLTARQNRQYPVNSGNSPVILGNYPVNTN